MKKEIYKIIKDFPDYSVSNYGNVKNNKTGKILKPYKCYSLKKPGYERYKIDLFKNQKRYQKFIHQLVARAFIKIPTKNPDGTLLDLKSLQINHKDYDTSNNKVSNLEWVDHAYNNRVKKQMKRIRCIETNEEFNCAYYAAQKYKTTVQNICNAANPNLRLKTAAGLHWEYI